MPKAPFLRLLAGLSLCAVACTAAPVSAQTDDFPGDDPSWARTEFDVTPSDHEQATKGLNTQVAREQDWPFFAAIRGTREGVITYDCGGSVISADWVLTAAHCVEGAARNAATGAWERPGSGAIEVVLGQKDLRQVEAGNVYAVTDVRISPDYTRAGESNLPVNDIALLKLGRPWTGDTVRLSAGTASDVDRFFGPAYFAGYGKTDMFRPGLNHYASPEGGFDAYTDRLRNAMIPTRNAEACSGEYAVEAYEPTSMICAGYDSGIVDSCQGDSGGPLIARDFAGRVYQIGIVSHGESCGVRRAPAVYTRVSGFRDFVKSVAPEAVFVDAKPEKTIYMTKAGLENLMKTLAPVQGKVGLKINDGATLFRTDDEIRIHVDSTIAGRLWVFDLDPSGAVTCMFPCTSSEVQRSLVHAAQQVDLPEGAVNFTVAAPTVPGASQLIAFVLPERMALIGDTMPDLGQTKGPIRTVWKSYSEILVYEAREAMRDDADPYVNTGMGIVTYSVRP